MRIAVVITTYNRPDALEAVLGGYLDQSDKGFELIVADDGSTGETAELVERFCSRAPFEVSHVWQEDQGFRAAAIRNKAVGGTDAEYIVFTDGDCIPSRTFVHQHRRLAEPDWFLSGNRVLLSRSFTRAVLEQRLPIQQWGWADWARARGRGDANRLMPLVRLPDGAFRKRTARTWQGVKTCNLSAWRADLLRVNGLDESYSGWGLEDSDLVIRLQHAGVLHKSARFAAAVFHLWHEEHDRSRLPENQERLTELLHSSRTQAVLGLDRHFPALARP
ncbi:MAG TPA: glycosyltransferase family 2 protein [Burkholderiales bacterium]|nr:glycosyltransferase family 2 protein [Burkholderiales bacterium]